MSPLCNHSLKCVSFFFFFRNGCHGDYRDGDPTVTERFPRIIAKITCHKTIF